MRTHLDHLETSGTAWLMLASHGPVFNTQNLNVGRSADWIGLDLSQNITPPRAPCGAKKWSKVDTYFSLIKPTKQEILHFLG